MKTPRWIHWLRYLWAESAYARALARVVRWDRAREELHVKATGQRRPAEEDAP